MPVQANNNVNKQPQDFIKPLILYSLPEYIDAIDKKWEAGKKREARVMALALPLFELKGVISNGMACALRIPGAALNITGFFFLMFIETKSLAFTTIGKMCRNLPTPNRVIILAAKTLTCAFGIVFAPLMGLANPKFNVEFHQFCEFDPKWKPPAKKANAKDKLPENNETTPKGFDAIVGMDDVKKQMQGIMNTVMEPELAKAYRLNPANGIIFYGPPGNGKTHFVERFAEQLEIATKKKVAVHKISSNDISKFHGETSANITRTFELAAQDAATNKSLSVLFIDEIDTIIPSSSVSSDTALGQSYATDRGTFLRELNEASKKNILVIGATNHLEQLDEAIVRPGRFDAKIHIPNPDAALRLSLLNQFFDQVPKEEGLSFEELAKKMEGWSVSDIKLFAEQVRIKARDKTIKRLKDNSSEKVMITQKMIDKAFKLQVSQRERLKQENGAKLKKDEDVSQLLQRLFKPKDSIPPAQEKTVVQEENSSTLTAELVKAVKTSQN